MIKILDHSKPLGNLVNDLTNGLGRINVFNAYVTEELNGIYECEFDILQEDKHFGSLEVGGLLEVPIITSNQIFRIYYISKVINGVAHVKCQHITYDLAKVPVKPFTSTGAVSTKNGLLNNIIGTYPFDMTTDISNTTSQFTLDIPRNFRECLGGYEGSVLDVFRGEYEWDNLTVKMLSRRGADNGVRISYGKNLTDFNQEENIQNVYTSVLGYAIVDDNYVCGNVYHKVVSAYPKVLIVDFSGDYQSGDTPTISELTTKAQDYATRNDIEVPSVNLTISFVPLYQTEEYKNIAPLERVFLGDTVHVYFDKLNVEANARVIKTVWNVNLQKYDEIELGSAKANLNSVIKDTSSEVVENALAKFDADIDVSWLDEKLDNMVSLIANGMGLHMTQDSAGRIFLHNGDTLANSQYQYQITSSGFMMSDDYGATWNSGWTTSGDAVMNSLATITLRALEIYGSYINGAEIVGGTITGGAITGGTITGTVITFGDISNKYITVQPYTDGVTFDGSGVIRMQPKESFMVNNLSNSNAILNEFVMGSSGTDSQAYITLKNYDYQNSLLANSIDMDARMYDDQLNLSNHLNLKNFDTLNGTRYLANAVFLNSTATKYTARVENYKLNSNEVLANQMLLNVSSTSSYAEFVNRQLSVDNYANRFMMSVGSLTTSVILNNFKCNATSASSLSNVIVLSGSPMNGNQNTISINNYDVDSDRVSNSIYLQKTSSKNQILLSMGRGSSFTVSEINMAREGTANTGLYIEMKVYTDNTYGYTNSILRLSGNGQVTITAPNGFYVNGTRLA